MKISRLMGILTILLQRDSVTAPELAERFEVSRRTINRDIEDICEAGVPIVTTQGRGGGISIAQGYKIDKTLFSEDELRAIFSGLRGMDSVLKTPYFADVFEKLYDKSRRIEADETVIIDLASHYHDSLVQKIDILKTAIRRRRIVSFMYYYEKGECFRRIEPYRIIFKWSAWYVLGYCLERRAFRLFKLNRLWEPELSGEEFVPREITENELRFDEYFSDGAFHLTALFSPSEKYRLIDEYGVDCYRETENGELLFERDFASYDNMRFWILGFGDKVRIIGPERLCLDRTAQAENIIKGDIRNGRT